MKTAKDVLNSMLLNSNTISKDAMVMDAFVLMETKDLDYVTVIENGNCVGIISEVDYMHKILLARKDPNRTKVKDIMTSCIHSVTMDEPIHRCLGIMDTFKIRHLVVFDSFNFKGVISLHDLMQSAYEENVDNLLEQEETRYIHS